jgi:hypothetical protein
MNWQQRLSRLERRAEYAALENDADYAQLETILADPRRLDAAADAARAVALHGEGSEQAQAAIAAFDDLMKERKSDG